MKKILVLAATLTTIATASMSAQAHRAWILPAATTLSGEQPWVSFDAAISNDIFHADYHALGLDAVKVKGPNNDEVTLQNTHEGKHRSNFDLNLKAPGSYKIFTANSGLNASWETEEGERKRWPGRGERPDPIAFLTAVPKSAKNLKVVQRSRRIETVVTLGEPSTAALQATNKGLEIEFITHPNDLYAGETAQFRFLIDGEPANAAQVSVIPGGMRYRTNQDELKLTSDKEGLVEIVWPKAGMYFLEAQYTDAKATAPATSRMGSYTASFEVLPQ